MSTQPHLQVAPGDVHPVALVPGDPDRVERIAGHCESHTEIASNREYTVVNARYDGHPLTICSTGIGSPSAAIAVEELLATGTETFIRVGTTGALQSDIDIGDYVVATATAKAEGTSKRYEDVSVPAAASADVVQALRSHGTHAETRLHVGPIVTDDAFYAETPEYVDDWEAAGLLAVEMEAAAIFTIARRNDARAGAICTVDGNLVRGTQKGASDEEGELPSASDAAIDAAIEIALEAAADLSR